MRRLLVVLVLVLAGCADSPTAPPAVEDGPIFGRAAMTPVPAAYAEWYAEVEACLTVSGDFAAVRWFLADSIIIEGDPRYHVPRRVGLWTRPDTITISRSEEHREVWLKFYMIMHVMQDDDPSLLHDVNGRVPCW